MYKISFLELSDITANQVKLPYSTGLIWGYCRLNPTIKENTNKKARDLHHIRGGKKLKNVINRRTTTVEVLQIELDQTGVNKKVRIQESLIRGSMTLSQLDLPETY